jgi:hypothetical protein
MWLKIWLTTVALVFVLLWITSYPSSAAKVLPYYCNASVFPAKTTGRETGTLTICECAHPVYEHIYWLPLESCEPLFRKPLSE